MKILIVLTSHDQLGDTGKKTGFWLEEFAAPYYVLRDAGATIILASPTGGQPPLDPKSELPENRTEATKRFRADKDAQAALADTKKLADVSASEFDAVFYPGGHGPMWDMPDNPTSIALIEPFVMADKPVAALCHAPAAFINVRGKDGEYLVKGKRVTGFTNAEEQAVGLTKAIMKIVDLSSRTGFVEEMDRLDSRQAHPTASPGTRFKEANVTNNHPVITGKIVSHQKALNARIVLAKLEAWRLKG